jgi:hypothetical protein
MSMPAAEQSPSIDVQLPDAPFDSDGRGSMGIALHPNPENLSNCMGAEYRFASLYHVLQEYCDTGEWISERGARVIDDGAGNPVFLQKAASLEDELSLALTVGPVVINGQTYGPGYLARLRMVEGEPRIAETGKLAVTPIDKVASACILRESAFLLDQAERSHWPPGDYIEPPDPLDPEVTAASYADLTKQVLVVHQAPAS